MNYSTTLSDIHLDVSYLLGETSVPASTEDDYIVRTRLIQNRAKRLWNKQNWEHLATTGTYGSTFTLAGRILSVDDGETFYDESTYEEYDENDYVYKKDGNDYTVGGTKSSFNVRYIPECPNLATTAINLPSEVIAKVALS